MAVVLVLRPWGLLGKPSAAVRTPADQEWPLQPASPRMRWLTWGLVMVLAGVPLAAGAYPYLPVLGIDILIAVLFAASLHFIMGPAGMHSFGHAAYFGLGAYGAALALKVLGLPMAAALAAGPLLALAGAVLFGALAVRLSGVYLAMLTLALAQIVWAAVFQWDGLTGGSNGLVGIWPQGWFADRSVYYLLALAVVTLSVVCMRAMLFSPFGYALRAGRDSPLRAEAVGHDIARDCGGRALHRWSGDGAAGRCALAGRTDRGRSRLHLAARHDHPLHRLLAGGAGWGDSGAGAGISAGPRGRVRSRGTPQVESWFRGP